MNRKIIIKVHGENPDLVQHLLKKNLTAKLIKNAVIISDLNKNEMGQYLIPDIILKNNYPHQLLINNIESGGGMSHTGYSQIICGLNGEKLKPYYQPYSGHLSCGIHAYFARYAMVEIHANMKNNISITKLSIKTNLIDRLLIDLVSEKIWEGQSTDLPYLYNIFDKAVEAALSKSRCYHCRTPHYILS